MMSRKIALTLVTLVLGTSWAYAKKAPKYEPTHQLTADQAATCSEGHWAGEGSH